MSIDANTATGELIKCDDSAEWEIMTFAWYLHKRFGHHFIKHEHICRLINSIASDNVEVICINGEPFRKAKCTTYLLRLTIPEQIAHTFILTSN